MKEKIKVIIADDNIWCCHLLEKFLEKYEEIEILGISHTDSNDDTRQEKIALIKYTYEQVLASQAEQVNGKSNNTDNVPNLAKNLLKDNNIIDIIPKERKFNVI